MKDQVTGTLYVVATPIGNLQDMSFRAVEILKQVYAIAAEDTRQTAKLLRHFSIQTPMFSLHQNNEQDRVSQLLARLREGENIALVSDAGTPLISDPGFHVVRELQAAGVSIVPIPGACAAITALSVAGLPTDRFIFEGFLPSKNEARLQRLQALNQQTATMIFYEAPHRVMDTLLAMQAVFGETRQAVTARELTKMFEQIKSGTLQDLANYFSSHDDKLRGEFVILVAGGTPSEETGHTLQAEQVLDILLTELPVKQAAHLASKIVGERKNRLYEMALRKKK